ncbi:MAG: DUF3352 domain-containing protein [Bacteroidales bacterium]|nr:DUF3352 domain-containing protein [Bacteroidales bacterium]HOY38155.1 DUF3352 domain-containing protein [Bacteroidales bacterium]HQP03053.1 DUF3352 domain-containing protein [Bacteroidales bacterium]
MKKKTLIIIAGIVLVVAIGAIVYFVFFSRKDVVVSESIKAIPANACIVIQIRDVNKTYEGLKEKSKIWNELSVLPVISRCDNFLSRISKMRGTEKIVEDLLSNNSLFISVHPVGKSKYEIFHAIAIPSDINPEDLIALFKKEYADSAVCSERSFENVTLYELKYNIGKRSLCFAIAGGHLIWSYSPLLVEESVNQMKGKKKSLADNEDFTTIYKSAGQKELANIYLQIPSLPLLLGTQLNADASLLKDAVVGFAGWTELDLGIDDTRFTFSGFTAVNDSLLGFVNVLQSQKPAPMTIETVLPANTYFYMQMAFTDANAYADNLIKFLKFTEQNINYEKLCKQAENEYALNLGELIYPLINREVGLAMVESSNGEDEIYSYLIINTKSRSIAENELERICEKISGSAKYKSVINIDEAVEFNVYRMDFPDIGDVLFGPVFSGLNSNYAAFYDNYLIFGNSVAAIDEFLRKALLNKTMATDLKHAGFMSGFSKNSNMFVYVNPMRAKNHICKILTEEALHIFQNSFQSISRISDIGLQWSVSEGMLYNYAMIQFDPEQREEPKTIWTSKLDSIVLNKPVIVVNHLNQSKEIIVQDRKNILHLISESGREIWKIPVDGRINSEVYQVDAFNNGKLQYLFSTETQIHLIDRLGNECDRFPVNLREKSNTGISLFDYENNRSYRIAVACNDKKVYLYDIEGKLVKGWMFETSDNPVLQSPQHFRVGSADYIVFNDLYKLYVVDRKGQTQAAPSTGFLFSENNDVFFDATGQERFIASAKNGTVYFMYLNGKTDSISFDSYSEKHFFNYYDIDNDGKKDFIFIDGGSIDVYKADKKKLFSVNLNSDINYPPYFYKFSRNQIKIGVVCKDKEQIYLLNDDGTLFEGFPLRGISPFSIGYLNNNSGSFNLVTGGKDNSLYNYEIKESSE